MNWKVVPYAQRHRPAVLALMEKVQGHPTSPQRFRWEFERNPGGDVNLYLAQDDSNAVVGLSCHSTFRMRLERREELVSFPLNVLTREDFRGRGVFSTLEQANEEHAAEIGAALMVSFPNNESTAIFLGRLGWTRLEAPRLLGRPRSVAPRRSDSPVALEAVPRFDTWADEIWAESSDLDRCLVRDSTYLNWRFVECPDGGYRVFAARRDREIVGYLVTGSTAKRGVRMAYVASGLMAPEWRAAYPAVRRAALACARAPLLLDLEAPWAITGGRWGSGTRYLHIPKRLNLIAKPLRPGLDESWIRERPWLFQLGDLDFF